MCTCCTLIELYLCVCVCAWYFQWHPLSFRKSSVSDFGGKKKGQKWRPGQWDRCSWSYTLCHLWVRLDTETELRVDMFFMAHLVVILCLVVYFRLFITGPVSHYFYQLMEVWMPTTDPYCIVKRLLLDRLFFAPGFLLLFYFVMNILEVGPLKNCPSGLIIPF